MKDLMETLEIEINDTNKQIAELREKAMEYKEFGERGKKKIRMISAEIAGMKKILKKLELILEEIKMKIYTNNINL